MLEAMENTKPTIVKYEYGHDSEVVIIPLYQRVFGFFMIVIAIQRIVYN